MTTKTLRTQSATGFTTKGAPLTNIEYDNTVIGLAEDIATKLALSGGALTGAISMTVSNANPALRITQTGSGHVVVFEDETNPDNTPFVITNNGSVIVGTTSDTGEKFQLTGSSRFNGPINAVVAGSNISVSGSGSTLVLSPDTVGSIDNVVIGATTPLAGSFTSVSVSSQFNGAGTGLTGTASGLSIGGNAATATSADALNTANDYTILSRVSFSSGTGNGYIKSNDATYGLIYKPTANGSTAAHLWVDGSGTALASINSSGNLSATTFTGSGSGLIGTASGLNIGGNAATATLATTATNAVNSTTQTIGDSTTKIATTQFVINQASALDPLDLGASGPSVGVSTRYSREDHVHRKPILPFSNNQTVYYVNGVQITAGRQSGVVYTNLLGTPLMVTIGYINYAGLIYCDDIDGSTTPIAQLQAGGGAPWNTVTFVVLNGYKFSLPSTFSAPNILTWTEWW